MQLHDVIALVEELRAKGALVGEGYLVARDAAFEAGFVLRVTSNRKVNIKGRRKQRGVLATVAVMNGWFKEIYGNPARLRYESDRIFATIDDVEPANYEEATIECSRPGYNVTMAFE